MEKAERALLVTDVVDSTRIVQGLTTEAAAELWAAQDAVARRLLRVWRGREIDKTDGFLLIFESVSDAAAYAIDYHAALTRLGEERGLPLAARAGLHFGEVVLRSNPQEEVERGAKPLEVEGVAKPLAARVMSVARGGQTLLSSAARSALADSPLRLESHGHWRMKGIAEPVELFEVGAASAPWSPPPDGEKVYRVVRDGGGWRPVREIPHALPRERDEFVGRGRELAALAALADGGAALVTLVGTGGTGKTRLARRFARSWLGDFPGGAWFCDLSGATELDGVLHAVAEALGVPLEPREPARLLAHAIAGRGRCLLVLDNFEQVVEVAAEVLDSWIERAPNALMLVTSREPLRLPGERVLALDPLPEREAAALFELRARAQRSGFELTAENRDDVAALVSALDGLPLAIELAAARSFELGPADLRAQLSERFELLGGARGVAARQATLRATIDWSWKALPEWAKAALAEASVFAGSLGCEAAEQVIDLSAWPEAPSVREVLELLTARSLLQARAPRHGGESESWRLLVSIQDYAAEKLRAPGAFVNSGPDAAAEVELRHGIAMAELGSPENAERVSSHGGVAVARRLHAEFENLVAACRRAIDRGDAARAMACMRAARPSLEHRGPASIGRELAHRILAMESLTAADRGLLLLYEGDSHRVLGDQAAARAAYETARELAIETGDLRLEAASLGGMGFVVLQGGRLDEAQELLEASLEGNRECGNRRSEAIVLDHLSGVRFHQGRLQECLEHLDAAWAIDRDIGHAQHEACVLGHRAMALHLLGRLDEALVSLEQALALTRESGDRRFEAGMLLQLGSVHEDTGRPRQAREYFEAALTIHREVGNVPFVGFTLGCLARNRAHQGRSEEARALFEEALEISREIGDQRNVGDLQIGLAELLMADEQLEEAKGLLDSALGFHRQVGDRRYEAQDLALLGDLHLEAGRPADARPLLEAALEIVRPMGDEALEGIVTGHLARADAAEGRLAEGREKFDRARELLTAARDTLRLGLLACARARAEANAGNESSAEAALAEAEALGEEFGAGPDSRLGRKLAYLRAAAAGEGAHDRRG